MKFIFNKFVFSTLDESNDENHPSDARNAITMDCVVYHDDKHLIIRGDSKGMVYVQDANFDIVAMCNLRKVVLKLLNVNTGKSKDVKYNFGIDAIKFNTVAESIVCYLGGYLCFLKVDIIGRSLILDGLFDIGMGKSHTNSKFYCIDVNTNNEDIFLVGEKLVIVSKEKNEDKRLENICRNEKNQGEYCKKTEMDLPEIVDFMSLSEDCNYFFTITRNQSYIKVYHCYRKNDVRIFDTDLYKNFKKVEYLWHSSSVLNAYWNKPKKIGPNQPNILLVITDSGMVYIWREHVINDDNTILDTSSIFQFSHVISIDCYSGHNTINWIDRESVHSVFKYRKKMTDCIMRIKEDYNKHLSEEDDQDNDMDTVCTFGNYNEFILSLSTEKNTMDIFGISYYSCLEKSNIVTVKRLFHFEDIFPGYCKDFGSFNCVGRSFMLCICKDEFLGFPLRIISLFEQNLSKGVCCNEIPCLLNVIIAFEVDMCENFSVFDSVRVTPVHCWIPMFHPGLMKVFRMYANDYLGTEDYLLVNVRFNISENELLIIMWNIRIFVGNNNFNCCSPKIFNFKGQDFTYEIDIQTLCCDTSVFIISFVTFNRIYIIDFHKEELIATIDLTVSLIKTFLFHAKDKICVLGFCSDGNFYLWSLSSTGQKNMMRKVRLVRLQFGCITTKFIEPVYNDKEIDVCGARVPLIVHGGMIYNSFQIHIVYLEIGSHTEDDINIGIYNTNEDFTEDFNEAKDIFINCKNDLLIKSHNQLTLFTCYECGSSGIDLKDLVDVSSIRQLILETNFIIVLDAYSLKFIIITKNPHIYYEIKPSNIAEGCQEKIVSIDYCNSYIENKRYVMIYTSSISCLLVIKQQDFLRHMILPYEQVVEDDSIPCNRGVLCSWISLFVYVYMKTVYLFDQKISDPRDNHMYIFDIIKNATKLHLPVYPSIAIPVDESLFPYYGFACPREIVCSEGFCIGYNEKVKILDDFFKLNFHYDLDIKNFKVFSQLFSGLSQTIEFIKSFFMREPTLVSHFDGMSFLFLFNYIFNKVMKIYVENTELQNSFIREINFRLPLTSNLNNFDILLSIYKVCEGANLLKELPTIDIGGGAHINRDFLFSSLYDFGGLKLVHWFPFKVGKNSLCIDEANFILFKNIIEEFSKFQLVEVFKEDVQKYLDMVEFKFWTSVLLLLSLQKGQLLIKLLKYYSITSGSKHMVLFFSSKGKFNKFIELLNTFTNNPDDCKAISIAKKNVFSCLSKQKYFLAIVLLFLSKEYKDCLKIYLRYIIGAHNESLYYDYILTLSLIFDTEYDGNRNFVYVLEELEGVGFRPFDWIDIDIGGTGNKESVRENTSCCKLLPAINYVDRIYKFIEYFVMMDFNEEVIDNRKHMSYCEHSTLRMLNPLKTMPYFNLFSRKKHCLLSLSRDFSSINYLLECFSIKERLFFFYNRSLLKDKVTEVDCFSKADLHQVNLLLGCINRCKSVFSSMEDELRFFHILKGFLLFTKNIDNAKSYYMSTTLLYIDFIKKLSLKYLELLKSDEVPCLELLLEILGENMSFIDSFGEDIWNEYYPCFGLLFILFILCLNHMNPSYHIFKLFQEFLLVNSDIRTCFISIRDRIIQINENHTSNLKTTQKLDSFVHANLKFIRYMFVVYHRNIIVEKIIFTFYKLFSDVLVDQTKNVWNIYNQIEYVDLLLWNESFRSISLFSFNPINKNEFLLSFSEESSYFVELLLHNQSNVLVSGEEYMEPIIKFKYTSDFINCIESHGFLPFYLIGYCNGCVELFRFGRKGRILRFDRDMYSHSMRILFYSKCEQDMNMTDEYFLTVHQNQSIVSLFQINLKLCNQTTLSDIMGYNSEDLMCESINEDINYDEYNVTHESGYVSYEYSKILPGYSIFINEFTIICSIFGRNPFEIILIGYYKQKAYVYVVNMLLYPYNKDTNILNVSDYLIRKERVLMTGYDIKFHSLNLITVNTDHYLLVGCNNGNVIVYDYPSFSPIIILNEESSGNIIYLREIKRSKPNPDNNIFMLSMDSNYNIVKWNFRRFTIEHKTNLHDIIREITGKKNDYILSLKFDNNNIIVLTTSKYLLRLDLNKFYL